jgi:tetratricopeptide (TPR) repeat protein
VRNFVRAAPKLLRPTIGPLKEARMNVHTSTQITHRTEGSSSSPQLSEAQRFVENTPLRVIFGIPEEALDAVMATAYQLYDGGRHAEVEVLCRGLIAADHSYWWSYSLYAATLRRLGKLEEALAQLEIGLRYEPDEPKLLSMGSELRDALAERDRAARVAA